ncbi:Twin-arginine translocation pathway signal [Shewanella piezotolerans WP3]|uniref:Twin-arginine translocation pathway signal n=1 Tax=Shewanella piezotolerans (strain WP3 / JCM 13877) TaxID=225849 RepID=B8CVG7_SHEPW|nr:formate dehydrogenase subunit alpha [Shewanella piezotolerans]ACJ31643.1 Twin-arginine translocation pathway signal [Shewanella piezotolerans WP3]
MRLTRKTDQAASSNKAVLGLNRRQFLKSASLATGGIAAASMLGAGMMRKAEAKDVPHSAPTEVKRTICSHCSVGCGIYAEVQNGVWTGQEPAFDHPFNAGGHCAKGAALREHGHGEKRLKYPMKLEGGKWKRLSWDQAIEEVGQKALDIRKESGPDSVFFMGSAKFSNEQAYMYRKFAAMWGTNNVDHSARICHSTTVAGVANTWGYGAQTNSFNDIRNAKAMMFIGSNPCEAHPVAMQHILEGKERGAKIIVVDPRFTRTAAKSDEFVHIRPGTDIPFIYGLLWHIFENGWEDKTFIAQRVYGMERIREEVKKFDPAEVENVVGVPKEQMYRVAKLLAETKPGTVVWCMGGTQHHVGNANTRSYCILQLALGNMGVPGGGTNIFRGHDNVQGATDFGLLFDTLPGYYGLKTGSWKHWCNVWDLDYEWVKNRFDQEQRLGQDPMTSTGIPCSRWHDGVLEDKSKIAQKDNIRMSFFWGQSVNTETRGREVRDALNKMDTVVVVDPFPTMAGVMHERTDGVYLLPASTQFETYGSVSASNRSLQWRTQVIEPLFESKPDHVIMYKLAKKWGIEGEFCKHIKVNGDEPLIEDMTREFNKGMWTIGYTGQSPERLKMHQENWGTFDIKSLEAPGGPARGETYGLPWPCWGTPEMKHPGSQILYRTGREVKNGGGNFRARYGVEHNGNNILAEGSYSKGSEIKDGYPEFTDKMLKQLGWWDDLTAEEKVAAEGKNWKTDISGGIQRVAIKHGCIPYGNAKARCIVWNFPDDIPLHREPLYTPRRDLVSKYPTYEDRMVARLPTLYKSIQEVDFAKDFPLAVTTGRLVEYEGGGEETRSNPWLAELQQEMFIEINPADAADRGLRDGDDVFVHSPEGAKITVKAMVTPRVIAGECFMPYHFAGVFEGKSLEKNYPEGTVPYVIGESANTVMTYGYDVVTQMQETKSSLCQISKA